MKKKTMSETEQDERLSELFKQTALEAELDALMAELVPEDNPLSPSEERALDTENEEADSAEVTQFRRLRVPPQESSKPASGERRDTNEFRAAASSGGSEKPRALRDVPNRKTPIGEVQGAKGKCSFYAFRDRISVGFDGGQAPLQIFLRGLQASPYKLSTEPDADGHYEIAEVTAVDIAQFLALHRKPRW